MRKFNAKKLAVVCMMLAMTCVNLFAHAFVNPTATKISMGIVIKGTVVDNVDGTALVGATVQIKGTTRGTVTNAEGMFTLDQVNEGDVLVFRYMGYREIEYVVPKTDEPLAINIRMNVDLNVFGAVAVCDEVYQPRESIIQKCLSKVKSIF